ncbi:hypothetical protein C2G38_2033679 [Gigaspora rosea]|uniref:Uncharacterized protein n=1 Tax=Gigaspora rosea TaxID=44941 RepID=A0A397VKH5_9GLOM|nr:hypothetical protein C2G38_2033679 [Gigaspora rosea]
MREDIEAVDEEEVSMIKLVEVVGSMARIFYEREHTRKEGPIYLFDEMRELLPQIDPSLKNFFDQLYLLARPFERCEQTMGRMKRLMVFLCYLLASLNNLKINSFKFDLAYYLDSVGTNNEGLNTLANIGITTTARAVDHKKKKISETHKEYIEKVLKNCSENSFVLNIDDYYNIHTPRQQPDTTDTSWAVHMATIITNPCPIPAIPRNGALNPKIVDDELIMKHLDERFIANLGISYHDRIKGKGSNNDLIEKLILHSYDDRLAKKKSDRHIQNAILFDFVESNLKSVENYTKALQIVHDQEPMGEYLSNHIIPIVADWPGQFFIRKAIAHRILLNNEVIPQFVTAFLPMMGPIHISLNSRELVFDKYSLLFNDIYKGIFGENKVLGKTPRPWRIDLILYIMRMAWLDIVDFVYLKFGNACKNIEFLYLTDLLSNLIPLVLDVYAVHHREGNWPAYEEACMRCWSDLFLRFDRKNYKRALLMFFSDIFFWMDTNHPLMDMITNRLASLSDCPVELVHSIIRRRTAKFSEAEQLQKEARFIFQHREDNAFRKYFVDSVKYPYTPKQLHILSRKCAVLLLGLFKKIYQARYRYSLIINSSNNINTYKLYSLGYEITDRHLPRGFVTSRKPFTTTLCDYLNCNCIDYSDCGKVLACGHGYHNQCLEKCQFKCLICLDYLKDEIKKNVDALKVSLVKKLGDNEFIDERRENIVEDNIDNVEIAAGDTTIEELEFAKKSFLEL